MSGEVTIRHSLIGVQGPEGVQGAQGPEGPAGQDGALTGPLTATEGHIALFGVSPNNLVDGGSSLQDFLDALAALDGTTLKKDGSVALAGDMSLGGFRLTSLGDPTGDMDAANKAYVDQVSVGLTQHAAVACATTANISLTGEQTLDGILTSTSRVLVKAQTDATQNGIYVSAAGAWARATDMAAASSASGQVPVTGGTLAANSVYVVVTTSGLPVVGTDTITFSKYLTAGVYTSGNGVTITGQSVALNLGYAATWTAVQSFQVNNSGQIIQLVSTDDGAAAAALDLYRDSASPTANDILFALKWFGRNSAATKKLYAQILTQLLDPTNGSEDTISVFYGTTAGAFSAVWAYGAGIYTAGAVDPGAGKINAVEVQAGGVALITPDTTFTTFSGGKATGVRDRMKNSIRIPDDVDCDMTGATGTLHTALAAAVAEALARSRAEVIIGPGRPKIGDTCTLTNTDDTKHVRIIGHGRATRIGNTVGDRDWFQIGATGATVAVGSQSRHFTFEDMCLEASTTMTAGAMMKLRNARYMDFKGVSFENARQALSLGIGASALNDVGSITLERCAINPNGAAGVPLIDLGSGGSLLIEGNMTPFYNAPAPAVAGTYLISHSDPVYNWDGLWVYHINCTDFWRYLSSTGAGVGNVQWMGGQLDGAREAFYADSPADGNHRWDLLYLQLLNDVAAVDEYPLVWKGIGDVTMDHCQISSYSKYIDAQRGSVYLSSNVFEGCGRGTGGGGTELIRFGAEHGQVSNNRFYPRLSSTQPTNAVNWVAPVIAATRSTSANAWRALTDVGTP